MRHAVTEPIIALRALCQPTPCITPYRFAAEVRLPILHTWPESMEAKAGRRPLAQSRAPLANCASRGVRFALLYFQ